MTLKVGILGGGSWGTTVASLTAKNSPTLLWARDEQTVSDINFLHRNEKYLSGLQLHEDLRATTCMKTALETADVVVIGVPSQNYRKVLEEAKNYIRPWVPIISLSKGLEQGTRLRMTQIIESILPQHPVGGGFVI